MSDNAANDDRASDGGQLPPADRSLHDDVRFEDGNIGVFRIAAVLAAIVAVFVGVAIVCAIALRLDTRGATQAPGEPAYNKPSDKMPNGPRLEPLDRTNVTAASDVFAKQIAMERDLHSYGDSAEKGFMRIPIEQAMKQVIQELPARKDAAQLPAKSFGLSGGGESNSGRTYSEGPSWQRNK